LKPFASNQLPLILYAALIFAVSSISKLPTPDLGIAYLDKLVHFGEYFIFLLLMHRALANRPVNLAGFWLYFPAIAVSIIFAALDEYHQSFVPGRDADLYDLLSDSIGIILAAVLLFLLHKRRNSTSRV